MALADHTNPGPRTFKRLNPLGGCDIIPHPFIFFAIKAKH